MNRVLGNMKRACQFFDNFSRYDLDISGVCTVLQNDGKFIAAETRNDVGIPNTGAQPYGLARISTKKNGRVGALARITIELTGRPNWMPSIDALQGLSACD